MQKRSLTRIWLIFVILSVLTACSQGTGPGASPGSSPTQAKALSKSGTTAPIQTSALLWQLEHSFNSSNTIWSDMRHHFALPDASNNPAVQAQIRWFQSNPQYLQHIFNNSAPFIYYVYEQTQKRGLPAEVALLPFIESSYSPFDYSKVGAVGLWQMMPGTASGFHLKINYWYDGRRDIAASTNAALTYLTYLDAYFNNNWLLAFAAYDAGEGKIQRVAHHTYNETGTPVDFWQLQGLPKETKSYVPKLLAIVAIVKDPARYGITLPTVPDQPYLQQVQVDSQINLQKAAKLANLDPTVMRHFNPGFRRSVTDPNGPHTLLLPANNASIFKTNLAALPEEERLAMQSHQVKPGETLKHIATRFHTTTQLLIEANHLSTSIVHKGQDLLIPEAMAGSESGTHEPSGIISEDKIPGPQRIEYTIKKHDTLATIAQHYGVKAKELRYWNNLTDDYTAHSGQQLLIWKPTKHHLVGVKSTHHTPHHAHHHKGSHIVHSSRTSARIASKSGSHSRDGSHSS